MDEMTLLREFRSGVPATDVTPEAEEAFITSIKAELASRPAGRRHGTTRRLSQLGGRYHWRFAVAAAMSVALAIGLIAVVGHNSGRPGPAPAQPRPGGGAITTVLAQMAAARAAAQPPVAAGQWVYSKTVTESTTPAFREYACRVKNAQGQVHDVVLPLLPGLGSVPSGTPCSVWSNGMLKAGGLETGWPRAGSKPPHVTSRGTIVATMIRAGIHRTQQEQWATADGTRQASYSAKGKLDVSGACSCGLVGYSNLDQLPSTPKALVRWAMRPPRGGGHYTEAFLAWNAFNGIEGTLMSLVLPPKVAAELYRALGDIPGVTVNKDAVDAAGRHGPAFVVTDPDSPGGAQTAELFLNPHTYQLTGYADQFPTKCECPSPGTSGTAFLRQAFVSGPGVRP